MRTAPRIPSTCAALATLAVAACSGTPVSEPSYDFRAALLNPGDETRAYADADEPKPAVPVIAAPSHRAPVASPPRPAATRPAATRPGAARSEPAHVAEPATTVAARPGAAAPTPVPPAKQSAETQVSSHNAEPLDGADALRATQRVDAAAALLGTPGMADRAFVAHVLRAAGQDVEVDRSQAYPRALYDRLKANAPLVDHAQARPGDLVFFRDTADSNGNGKPDDGVTMVGVVERIEGSRAVFIAQRAEKVRRMAVDPTRPMVVRDDHEQVVNTRLVRWPGAQLPLTTGQCLVGYVRPR